ncbi:MAG TPA: hypothetical protein VJQ59_01895 [Candidatus Sulfotelmatobacter sp.]|nr:hypothetical protein [Candidatus Sulfotelmatobacter sp.]
MRRRIAISSLIGVAAGAFCLFLMRRLHQGAGDFNWTIHLAQRWLARQNPYDTPYEQYPFTAALFGLPFGRVPREIAAGIFFGISSGLMAFGLARDGYHKLLVFLAYPYWIALLYVQWAPLILASAFVPLLLPVTMAKPQVGLPIFLTRLSKRGFWACIVVGIASLAMLPRWPVLWLGQLHNYEHFIALLVLPGPLILLALLRYRDRDAILLLLTACMPQRWFFDALILWLIPKTRREIIVTVFFSWCAGIWRYYHPPHSFTAVGRLVVIFIYLPMLAIVLLRGRGMSWGARKTALDKAQTTAN